MRCRRKERTGALGVAALLLGLLSEPPPSQAQPQGGGSPAPEAPVKGPADAIRRAQQVRPPAETASAPADGTRLPADHPRLPPEQQRVLDILAGRLPPVGRATSSDEVPEGTIEVRVQDPAGRPLRDVTVQLGILAQEGGRQHRQQRTDAQGTARFEGLASGSGQAYRVSALSEGVRFAADPFRLEPGRGVRVELRLHPVSHDARRLVLGLGHVELSLKEERVRVVEQIELWQLAEAAYRFPEEGLLLELPEGFKALQVQERMREPRLVKDERGVRITGAMMPGRATLLFAYDLPIDGERMDFAHPLPWKVARFRVVAEAAEGLKLRVDGMPPPRRHDVKDRAMWVTEIDRKPEAPPFDRLSVHLEGLPGPGPMRWLAVLAALLFAAVGAVSAVRGRSTVRRERLQEQLAEARRRTLQEMAALRQERSSGEVGPSYFERRQAELRERLAWILRVERRLGGPVDGRAEASS